jgi:alkylhydroperoxidase family enzyme
MTRIPVLQPPGRQDAVIPHVYRPRMAAAMEQLSAAVYQETTLSYREAEGARIRIAQINGCLMCQSYRIAEHLPAALQKMGSAEAPNTGKSRGEAPTEDFYKAVAIDWRASEVFSDRERLAIEYAERISLEPVPLPYDDAFWDRLHAHFDEGEIADLTYSITTWIATGRIVHALGLDGACAIQPARLESELGPGKIRGRAAQGLIRTP